ncbi:hypothetical protein AGMMS4957_20450 [Bacteroidia bacterium]|nr:hypothetical protein AGMMS4957_20450 [Bacteroidia bacterium]
MEKDELNALLDKTRKEELEAGKRMSQRPFSAEQLREQVDRNNRAMGIRTG